MIRIKQLSQMRPLLEAVLSPAGRLATDVPMEGLPDTVTQLTQASVSRSRAQQRAAASISASALESSSVGLHS